MLLPGRAENVTPTHYSIDDPRDTWYVFTGLPTGLVSAFPPEETRVSCSFPSDRHYPMFRWHGVAALSVHGGRRMAMVFARRAGVQG